MSMAEEDFLPMMRRLWGGCFQSDWDITGKERRR